jgi:hypothetical protein
VWIVSDDRGAETMCAFTWDRPRRAVVESAFLAFLQVSLCYYQYDLNTVHMALDCHAVGSAGVIQMSKKVTVPAGVEDMVLVVK